MADCQGFEVLQRVVQTEGLPKLFDVLYLLLSERNLLPRPRCGNISTTTKEHTAGESAPATESTQWQPLGIQVAHTLLSLCMYPESSVQALTANDLLRCDHMKNNFPKSDNLVIDNQIRNHQKTNDMIDEDSKSNVLKSEDQVDDQQTSKSVRKTPPSISIPKSDTSEIPKCPLSATLSDDPNSNTSPGSANEIGTGSENGTGKPDLRPCLKNSVSKAFSSRISFENIKEADEIATTLQHQIQDEVTSQAYQADATEEPKLTQSKTLLFRKTIASPIAHDLEMWTDKTEEENETQLVTSDDESEPPSPEAPHSHQGVLSKIASMPSSLRRLTSSVALATPVQLGKDLSNKYSPSRSHSRSNSRSNHFSYDLASSKSIKACATRVSKDVAYYENACFEAVATTTPTAMDERYSSDIPPSEKATSEQPRDDEDPTHHLLLECRQSSLSNDINVKQLSGSGNSKGDSELLPNNPTKIENSIETSTTALVSSRKWKKGVLKARESHLLALNLTKLADKLRATAEEDRNLREKPPRWWLIQPSSLFHGCWDIFMTVNLTYVLLLAPVVISFDPEPFQRPQWAWWLDNVVNLAYCIDIIVNFCTGVYVPVQAQASKPHGRNHKVSRSANSEFSEMDGGFLDDEEMLMKDEQQLSYSMKDISDRYLRGWFFIDLISSLPWDSIFLDMMSSTKAHNLSTAPRLIKLMRLARLIKLLKMHRLKKILGILSEALGTSVVELLKMFVGVCILCHYMACGFYFIAVMTDESGKGTWLENYLGSTSATDEYSKSTLYINSVYWGFTTVTSVGYGDIFPITLVEKSYAAFVMYSGVAVMAVITGKLAAVIATFDSHSSLVESQLQSVRLYCKYRDLPLNLRRTVCQYFERKARQKIAINEEEILQDMSPSLKAQVVCTVFKPLIQCVPFFRGCSEMFLSALLCCMEPILFAPADIIIQKGQKELAMYVLTKGTAAVVGSHGKVLKELGNGSHFGEIGLFFGVRRTATVCSVTFCDTFKLMQENFVKVQDMYPDMQKLIDEQAESMFQERITCYMCGKNGHVSIQCLESQGSAFNQHATVRRKVSNSNAKKLQTVSWLGNKRGSILKSSHVEDESESRPSIKDLVLHSFNES